VGGGLSNRSNARGADADYANPPRTYLVNQLVRSNGKLGRITHIAFSQSMDAPVYTVAFDTRITLRLLGRDLEPVEAS
jgi:hypothetical protein